MELEIFLWGLCSITFDSAICNDTFLMPLVLADETHVNGSDSQSSLRADFYYRWTPHSSWSMDTLFRSLPETVQLWGLN